MTEADLYFLYRGVYVPNLIHTEASLDYFQNFTFRPQDVLIVTYPKSTTWMQEVVPLIVSGGDPASVETIPNWDRVPWLEEVRASILNLEGRPSPRMLTTHFHYSMMPPSFFKAKPKLQVIYVMRNPKDVFTSIFHYSKMASFLVTPDSQSEFLQKFLDGKIFGSWFDHVSGWLNADDKDRIMYISYEEMIMQDLKDSVARISQFLEKTLDDEVISKIADRCLFKNMKQNNMSNYSAVPKEFMDQTKSQFLRKISGDWKNQLTAAEADHFDAVYRDKIKDVQHKFVWD
uniref:Sulfotransferase n=1 Tax=Oryzias latipes TaxID=8090 RepID=A0A3P9JK31_ORYLA